MSDVYKVNNNGKYLTETYLPFSSIGWWLGTGQYYYEKMATYVESSGEIDYGYSDGGRVIYLKYVRPAFTLSSNVILDCIYGTGDEQCDGSSTKPFKIRNSD